MVADFGPREGRRNARGSVQVEEKDQDDEEEDHLGQRSLHFARHDHCSAGYIDSQTLKGLSSERRDDAAAEST